MHTRVLTFFSNQLTTKSEDNLDYLNSFIKLFVLHCSLAHGLFLLNAPKGHLLKYSIVPFFIAFLLSWFNKSQKGALWIIAIIYTWDRLKYPLWSMPITANHVALEYLTVFLLLFLSFKRKNEINILLVLLRFLCIFVFFYAGIQKVLYGTFFNGQFLAFEIAVEETFRTFFSFFIPSEQIKEVQNFHNSLSFTFFRGQWIDSSSGSYLIKNNLILIFSNFAWISEILVGILLFTKRYRVFGAILGIATLFAIEIAARELFFGLLYSSFMLLFLDKKYIEKARPFIFALYIGLALCVLEYFPLIINNR